MKKINKWIYWPPRIISIIFILFITILSLDVFSETQGFWQTFLALLIQDIPAIILLIVLIISWKYEIVGGVVYTLVGSFYLGVLTISQPVEFFTAIIWFLTIGLPPIIAGALFLIGWFKKN